jgi:hypothetical protein
LPNERQAPKELKVTDKRIFTPEGDIRDEFKADIKPSDPRAVKAPEAPPAAPPEEAPKPAAAAPQANASQANAPQAREKPAEERRRPAPGERVEPPSTPFALFIEQLIAQAYMALGMLRNPYQPQAKVDPAAARQMIDILQMLQEKTQGNLSPEEEDFLEMHLGELKLAYVQRTKSI